MTLIAELREELERAREKAALVDQLARQLEWEPAELADLIRDGSLANALKAGLKAHDDLTKIYAAFPCAECGKSIEWRSSSEFVKALQHAMREGRWTWKHTSC